MAYEFYSPLEFRSGFISGMLAGKSLNCLVNPSQGSAPPAGVYQIQPPIEDVVFGQLAVMTPVGGAAGTGALGTYVKLTVGASASLFDKLVGPADRGSKPLEIVAVGGATAFVLSSRPIPGRNCLVIQSNFDDLMDALKSTGGATVRFA